MYVNDTTVFVNLKDITHENLKNDISYEPSRAKKWIKQINLKFIAQNHEIVSAFNFFFNKFRSEYELTESFKHGNKWNP